MNNNSNLHVVLGSNGNIGKQVVKVLQQKGIPVKGVTRSGNGPNDLIVQKADALNYNELESALKGASVIYHCLGLPYDQWFEKHPIIMKNLIKAASKNGSETKIIYADNLYAIGLKGAKLGKINEDTPELAEDRKGRLRIELENILMEAQAKNMVKVAIGKASDFYGPDASNSLLTYFVLPSLLKGKNTRIFGNLEAKHSWIYLPDFAEALVKLASDERSFGQSWILPHQQDMTLKNFFESFYKEKDETSDGNIKTLPHFLLRVGGLFNKLIKEYSQVSYMEQIDWIVDDTKFCNTFDFKTTPLDKSINETLQWYEAHPV